MYSIKPAEGTASQTTGTNDYWLERSKNPKDPYYNELSTLGDNTNNKDFPEGFGETGIDGVSKEMLDKNTEDYEKNCNLGGK